MTPRGWLRLYPRAWRERYGDEFEDLISQRPLTAWTAINIVSGAIDARLSSDARVARQESRGGAVMIDVLKQARRKAEVPFTMRDGLMGAGLMIGGTIALSAGGIWLRNHGWPDFGEAIKSLAFSASLTLTLPTMWLKGQPWRAQVAIVGGTLVILVIIGLASSHART